MFFFNLKKRYFLSTIFLCFSSWLSQSNIALAQMRLGRGIQRGLEGHLLEYQIQQQPLDKMRGISGCAVGIGVGCDKTASLLQKIVTEYSGKTYQDILVQAAGGTENYSNFTNYYSPHKNLDLMPLNSFWVNEGEYILDSYRYSGIADFNPISQSDLSQVVKRFRYAPITLGRDNISPKQGLIGLKTAYGVTLLEEARRIPNIEQKIAASGLRETEINFHLQQYINGIEAIDNGDRQEIERSLYRLLSNPYTNDPETLNRPYVGISGNLTQTVGVGLEGNEYIASIVGGEASETIVFNSSEVVTIANGLGNDNTTLYAVAGVGSAALLIILLTGSGENSFPDTANSEVTENPQEIEEPLVTPPNPDEEIPDREIVIPPTIVEKEPPTSFPEEETQSIPESTNSWQWLIAIAIAAITLRKKRSRIANRTDLE